ncbi:ABC transporter ATP-binding protein [Cohnella nanjingensis]|uniref:ABC transporter ATP-binding protein n=1 Tax=Cohnella nanjingensis TaxID=1387779 RepID=A0A7X0VI05_9BACL|nr:ABC transporter ATP-binding protein [Cohnella nanjingensis]MBB6674456.1 ABC transporter ATP-binding protein [Cohnella nanjingensis]
MNEGLTREPAAISLRGAAVRRRQFTLGPLTLDIPSGMVTAIVGPNGSGKSTLFRMLLQMEPYEEGEAKLLGARVGPGGDDAAKARIGFVAELPHAYEGGLTAEEKARFAAAWYPTWSWDRYRKLMRKFEAEGNTKLRKLSKGMRRKVELAIAMAHDPELLLLDEPSSGLDPFAWKTMLEELHRYMESGDRTLVLATHITEEVRRLADYVLFLHRGRSLGMYEKDQLFDAWRVFAIQTATGLDLAKLQAIPGVQGAAEAGPGIYRLETDRADETEEYCLAQGYKLLSAQRMEMEEILACLVRKEEAGR